MRNGTNYRRFYDTNLNKIERSICLLFVIFCLVKLTLQSLKLF